MSVQVILVMFESREGIILILYFGHSPATICHILTWYVVSLVHCKTLGCVRGLNRWEHEWLALSPRLNVKRHQSVAQEPVRFSCWPRDGGVIFIAFVSETPFGVKSASNWFGRNAKKIAVNVSFLLKDRLQSLLRRFGLRGMPFTVRCVSYR